jgi:hypothetical protein
MSIAAIKALRTAQNNLAPSRGAAITYGDGDLWDEYEHAIQSIELQNLIKPQMDEIIQTLRCPTCASLEAQNTELDAKLAAIEQAQKQERNFCPRCGKRLGKNDWDIHTCTPPAEQAQKQPDLDAICQDLQEKTYAQAMRIAELEQAQKEKQHGAD